MRFTTEKFTLVLADKYSERVGRGLTFTVDERKNAIPIDLSGRTVSRSIYEKYFAPPAPEPEPEPEPEQEPEEE